jgi:cellobiose phosphorylase
LGRGKAADTPHPQVALWSNGAYHVLITGAGAGVSTWRNLDVTRWREDATRDCRGQFVYVRGLEDGRTWSIGHQPLTQAVDEYQVTFHADRAEFRRRDGDVEMPWAICIAGDHDAEIRLVTLVNHGNRARELELTSYAEVFLNHRRADQGHPAFTKLFLETEFVPGPGALLARRRPRAAATGRDSRSPNRYRSATYRIRVENPAGAGRDVRSVLVDGQPVPGGVVPLRDDGRAHHVRVTLGNGKR